MLNNNDNGTNNKRKTFSDRLAWLGRMPRHYKILFGSQLLFTLFAIRMRYKLVDKQQQRQEKFQDTVG
jgi:hypothetical protein